MLQSPYVAAPRTLLFREQLYLRLCIRSKLFILKIKDDYNVCFKTFISATNVFHETNPFFPIMVNLIQ
jgi:hypothetical protein